MQTSMQRISPTKVKLLVTANGSDLDKPKNQAITKLARDIKVPGFRAGSAPNNLTQKHLDANLLSQETLDIALNDLYIETLIEKQLRPVKDPEVNIKAYVPFEQLEFEATVEIIGNLKLANYRSLKLPKPEMVKNVKAEDVNDVLNRMQQQLATIKTVDRAAKNDDQVIIDFSGVDSKTKDPIKGSEGKDYALVLGSNSFIPGFEENLIGLKAGEQKSFDLTFPADYSLNTLRKRKVIFSVNIKRVEQRILPPIDDSFATKVGTFPTLKDLKADIKKELKLNFDKEEKIRIENSLVEKIVQQSEVAIPDSLIEEELERIEREHRQNAAYRGQTWTEYLADQGAGEDDFAREAKNQAILRIKTGLVLGDLASEEGINVTNQEVSDQIEKLKNQYRDDQQMQQELHKEENLRDIKNRLMVEKTIARIMELNPQKKQ